MEGKNNKITNAIKMYAGNKVLYLKKMFWISWINILYIKCHFKNMKPAAYETADVAQTGFLPLSLPPTPPTRFMHPSNTF